MPEQWVEFTLQSARPPQEELSLKYVRSKGNSVNFDAQLLNELIDCGFMCIDAIHNDCNHRYRSWEYCYRVFSEPCDFSRERLDYLALHLAWYLGSWGMLRNSFLQDKDYKIHIPVVEILMDSQWEELRGLSAEKFVESASVDTVINLVGEINSCYQKYAGGIPTNTLLTKIVLGTIGCIPAYDRYFVYAVRKTRVASGTFNKRSLFQLGKFYLEHNDEMEALRLLCPSEIISYPPAKVIDMCFFGYGLKHDN